MAFRTTTLFLFSSLFFSLALGITGEIETPTTQSSCGSEKVGECYNKNEAMRLKIAAITSILGASMIGVCLPLFSGSVPALRPERNLFVMVKAFASGVILATGYMHVLPDSFNDLTSKCLPENPWKKFPFTTFVAMLSAIVTLMVDSFVLSFHQKKYSVRPDTVRNVGPVGEIRDSGKIGHGDVEGNKGDEENDSQLLRYRVVAQVLEAGIVVHSVVIGLSLGASQNPCTIRPLVAALCFHQLFEGMGLGGCILQAKLSNKVKAIMVFFFSTTTPFGIALGIGLSNVYRDNSPTALIVEGLLNASSAGLLNYMALVDLLAPEFMGPKLQSSTKLQIWAYICVLLGAGGMSLMAKWA